MPDGQAIKEEEEWTRDISNRREQRDQPNLSSGIR
jgi:hypothetical protein